jgi:hypothetical protein
MPADSDSSRALLALFLDLPANAEDDSLRSAMLSGAKALDVHIEPTATWAEALTKFAGVEPGSEGFTLRLVELMQRWHRRDGAIRIALSFAVNSLLP